MDELLTSLRVISMIKEGQKARIRDGLIFLEPNSYGAVTGLRRWLNRDNRVTTVRYIRNIINHALATYQKEPSESLKAGLAEAVKGIDSLCVTYGDDATTLASLTIIKEKILN
jgi:hypothetical protein